MTKIQILILLWVINSAHPQCTEDGSYLYESYHKKFGKYEELLTGTPLGKPLRCLPLFQRDNVVRIDFNNSRDWRQRMDKDAKCVLGKMLLQCFDSDCRKLMKLKKAMQKFTLQDITVTCPRGLLYDLLCLASMDTDCSTSLSCNICGSGLPHLCQDDVLNFINQCIDNTTDKAKTLIVEATENLVKYEHNMNKTCPSCHQLDLIYQGLTSLRGIEEDVIAIRCHDDYAVLVCYKTGSPVVNVRWNVAGTFRSQLELKLKYADYTASSSEEVVCYEDREVIATINANKIHDVCKRAEEEDINEVFDPPDDTNSQTTTPPTSNTIPTPRTTDFYEDNSIWLPFIFSGITAFSNEDNILKYRGKLAVAEITIFGRYTPVCGEHWRKEAANVFCREIGNQINETWVATHYGAISHYAHHTTVNYTFYNHYLKNLSCVGHEEHLIWCKHNGWFEQKTCRHDAIVICDTVAGTPDWWMYIGIPALLLIIIVLIIYLIRQRSRRMKPEDMISVATEGTEIECSHSNENTSGTPMIPPPKPFSDPLGQLITLMLTRFSSVKEPYIKGSVIEQLNPAIGLGKAPVYKFQIGHFSDRCIDAIEKREINGDVALPQTVVCKERQGGDAASEECFLKNTNHVNIVKYLYQVQSIFVDAKYQGSSFNTLPWVFFMEYLHLGSLDTFYKTKATGNINFPNICEGHVLTVENAQNIIMGLCCGLQYVHYKGYVHGDLSPSNILVYRDENGKLGVKLADFGLLSKVDGVIPQIAIGTALYMAPEMFLPVKQEVCHDPKKSEVWALGLIVSEVCSWISCCQNIKQYQQADHDSGIGSQPSSSGPTNQDSSDIPSMFETDDFRRAAQGCRKSKHIALLKELNEWNQGGEMQERPDVSIMKRFYSGKKHFTIPFLDPCLDQAYGWKISSLIEKCLAISVTETPEGLNVDQAGRYTMDDVMRHIHGDNYEVLQRNTAEILQTNLGQIMR